QTCKRPSKILPRSLHDRSTFGACGSRIVVVIAGDRMAASMRHQMHARVLEAQSVVYDVTRRIGHVAQQGPETDLVLGCLGLPEHHPGAQDYHRNKTGQDGDPPALHISTRHY